MNKFVIYKLQAAADGVAITTPGQQVWNDLMLICGVSPSWGKFGLTIEVDPSSWKSDMRKTLAYCGKNDLVITPMA